jgi:hypothetical protein
MTVKPFYEQLHRDYNLGILFIQEFENTVGVDIHKKEAVQDSVGRASMDNLAVVFTRDVVNHEREPKLCWVQNRTEEITSNELGALREKEDFTLDRI